MVMLCVQNMQIPTCDLSTVTLNFYQGHTKLHEIIWNNTKYGSS